MFLKQYNYKPRSMSQSSSTSAKSDTDDSPSAGGKGAASSANAEPGAVKGGMGSTPTPATNQQRRRSSASSPFSGLTNQKRVFGEDATSDAKKASFMEQKPGSGGILGNLWNNFTRGPGQTS